MTLLPGETVLKINGETRVLRLTLGALAEIEQSIGGGDFEKLRERLASPSVSDLLLILHALIAGGGQRVALDVLKASDIDFRAAAQAIGAAFRGFGNGQSAMESHDTRRRRSVTSPLGEVETARAVSGEGNAAGNLAAASSNHRGETPHPKSAPADFDLSQGRGEPPPKRAARRSPGKRGSAPESSQ